MRGISAISLSTLDRHRSNPDGAYDDAFDGGCKKLQPGPFIGTIEKRVSLFCDQRDEKEDRMQQANNPMTQGEKIERSAPSSPVKGDKVSESTSNDANMKVSKEEKIEKGHITSKVKAASNINESPILERKVSITAEDELQALSNEVKKKTPYMNLSKKTIPKSLLAQIISKPRLRNISEEQKNDKKSLRRTKHAPSSAVLVINEQKKTCKVMADEKNIVADEVSKDEERAVGGLDDLGILITPSTLSILSNNSIFTEYIADPDNDTVLAANHQKGGSEKDQVEESKSENVLEEMTNMASTICGCGGMSSSEYTINDQDGLRTIKIEGDEASFIMNHISEDLNQVEKRIDQLDLNEINDVEKSLNGANRCVGTVQEKDSSGSHQANGKQPLSEHDPLCDSTPEDAKMEYYRSLSRAAVLYAKFESMKAEIELKKIELEEMKLDEELDKVVTDESEEDSIDFFISMFKCTSSTASESLA